MWCKTWRQDSARPVVGTLTLIPRFPNTPLSELHPNLSNYFHKKIVTFQCCASYTKISTTFHPSNGNAGFCGSPSARGQITIPQHTTPTVEGEAEVKKGSRLLKVDGMTGRRVVMCFRSATRGRNAISVIPVAHHRDSALKPWRGIQMHTSPQVSKYSQPQPQPSGICFAQLRFRTAKRDKIKV